MFHSSVIGGKTKNNLKDPSSNSQKSNCKFARYACLEIL